MKTSQYGRQEQAIAAADSSFDTTWYGQQEARIKAASQTRVAEYVSPPAATTDHGYIYVIEFSTGVVKVGRSINPTQRLATHARVARVHGVDIRQSWISERHHGCRETERKLIEFCRRRGTQIDDEHFRNIAFEEVRFVAQLLAEIATNAELLASRVADDAKRRAHLDKLIDAAGGDMDMLWQDAEERLASPPIPLAA